VIVAYKGVAAHLMSRASCPWGRERAQKGWDTPGMDEVLAQLEAVRELVESGAVEASPEERGWLRGVCDALRVVGEAVSLS
jgi:hypothetical protein